MKFSVVIPALNEEKNIARLLTELTLITTQAEVEIIVVDGGSSDRTAEVARKFAHVYQADIKSRGAQLRLGAAKSHGEYLWFLHADSQINPTGDRYAEMVNCLQQPKVSAGFYRLRFDRSDLFFRYLSLTSTWRARYLGLIFGDQGLFVSRELYEAAGGFDEVPLMEDWLLSRRLKKLGRFSGLNTPIYTSSRRFARGKLRTHLQMHRIKLLFLFGMSPERLAQKYYRRK